MIAVALANLPATALAQNTRSQAPPYCFDLSRIVDLAVTKERCASIAGWPRQGDFRDAAARQRGRSRRARSRASLFR